MTQHGQCQDVRVVPKKYDMDTLGAPFKVVLLDSVTVTVDPETGEEIVSVPDTVGLINAVVKARACHSRKLSGPEIKYIRDALGVRAKNLAQFLDISPEHLSRCENGEKVLSSTKEQKLRSFAFLATLFTEPEKLLEMQKESPLPNLKENLGKIEKMAQEFLSFFFSMKIQAAFSPEELVFEFTRKPVKRKPRSPHHDPAEDGDWRENKAA